MNMSFYEFIEKEEDLEYKFYENSDEYTISEIKEK